MKNVKCEKSEKRTAKERDGKQRRAASKQASRVEPSQAKAKPKRCDAMRCCFLLFHKNHIPLLQSVFECLSFVNGVGLVVILRN